MDFIKDALEAMNQRIRSPFFGSILISWLAINWREASLLLFAEKPLHERIADFDAGTDLESLLFGPVALGIAVALALPWVRLIGAWAAERPTTQLRQRQQMAAQKERIARIELDAEEAEARSALLAAEEQAKIDAAARLNEAKETDADLAEELENSRDGPPREAAEKYLEANDAGLSQMEKTILEIAAKSLLGRVYFAFEQGEWIVSPMDEDGSAKIGEGFEARSHRERLEMEGARETLEKLGALERIKLDDGDEHEITEFGYRLLDRHKAEEIPF